MADSAPMKAYAPKRKPLTTKSKTKRKTIAQRPAKRGK